ncbi:MAG: SRPBCC family protein [Bacteroidetes bacterium]|nr:SRPBCC family protein [Bacteroidota bacterium]
MIKEKCTSITAEFGKQELKVVREFNAPRELVFQAWIDPQLFIQWVKPRELNIQFDSFDARTGGFWKYMYTDKEQNEFSFHGVFHEVFFPERIVQTFECEGQKGRVAFETNQFEDLADDKTKVTITFLFRSAEDRDALFSSGMERDIHESHERLDELLAAELSKS